MKVLVLNCGSSSVKFQLIAMTDEQVLAKGIVEKIGASDAIITYQARDQNRLRETREVLNHEVAVDLVISMLLHPQHGVIRDRTEIDGIGHRVVHGGEDFSDSVLVTDEVVAAVRKCIQFAPLHNPHNLKGIEACERLLPGVPQTAVFDTAFHHTIPPQAYLYGLPYALYEKLGIRRYGFHGTSHKYVAHKAAEFLGKPAQNLKLITCHLGNGASVTAIDGGKSIDTSMGFTPLEGLIMGTRCGDIDPALVPYIMNREKLTADQMDAIMNKHSGMLGLTGTSNDMREIEAEVSRGSERHKLAVDIYCHRIKKYIGAYMAELGGCDAVIFTGGIGENSRNVRMKSVSNLTRFGIAVDAEKNRKNEIAIGTGPVAVLVIPTNEELAIARDTKQILVLGEETLKKTAAREAGNGRISHFVGHEKADLVLLWAEEPGAKPADLARKLSKKLSKPITTEIVREELEYLGLT
ncbi:MAG TPA: acetate kinase [bacterium]|nr:acetate kinase [bacterium]